MKKIMLLIFLSFFNLSSYGFSVLTLKPVDWSKVRSVDIFIAGYGEELGLQFLYSAITKARVMDEIYPDSRVQIIFWAKEKGRERDIEILEKRDLNIIAINDDLLTSEIIYKEIKRLKRISSLHILSHNAAFYGNRIQSKMTRIDGIHFPWSRLTNDFLPGSYVVLHGCNTGFVLAPQISEALQRPVLGSMTSTDFQEIFTDGSWYHNNPGQYPSSMNRMSTNRILYEEDYECWKGNCHRLMSNNHPYRGYWGEYEVGLPFFKSFCNYPLSTSRERETCYRGIAQALKAWPTVEGEDFESKVFDFLCPRHGKYNIFSQCVDYLRGKSEKKFFWGETLPCTLKECEFATVETIIEGRPHPSIGKKAPDQGMKPFRDEFLLLQKVRPYFK